jgi:hypothetical protein
MPLSIRLWIAKYEDDDEVESTECWALRDESESGRSNNGDEFSISLFSNLVGYSGHKQAGYSCADGLAAYKSATHFGTTLSPLLWSITCLPIVVMSFSTSDRDLPLVRNVGILKKRRRRNYPPAVARAVRSGCSCACWNVGMFYYCGAVSEQRAARCIAATGALLERGLPRDVESLHPRALLVRRRKIRSPFPTTAKREGTHSTPSGNPMRIQRKS